jgi:hypothetical protein
MLRYGQFCPVAKAAELCFGPRSFGDLLFAMPLISRAMLAQRLREMADAGVVSTAPKAQGRGHLYRLTPAGEDFRPIIEQMSVGATIWRLCPLLRLPRQPTRKTFRFSPDSAPALAARKGSVGTAQTAAAA